MKRRSPVTVTSIIFYRRNKQLHFEQFQLGFLGGTELHAKVPGTTEGGERRAREVRDQAPPTLQDVLPGPGEHHFLNQKNVFE